MTINRSGAAAILATLLLVGACGGSASQSPSQAPSAAASEAPTAAATQAAAASTAPSMPAVSLAPGNAGDLEAMIPSTVGSITFQKTSFDGASIPLAGTPIDQTKLDPLLSKYGKSVADMRFAIGIGAGGSGATLPTMVYALQIKGVPAKDFMSQVDSSSTSSTTMGGKTVYNTSAGGMSSVLYPKDDVLFIIVGSDADAQSIVAALP
jgi:hypothetical protein